MKLDTKVTVAGVTLKNPVMNASGTFGNGREYAEYLGKDGGLSALGAVVTKGVSATPWEGNPTPRIAETPAGMLNAIGLQNPGVDVFLERELPFLSELRAAGTRVIVNVCGHSVEEYLEVIEKLSDADIDMLEINVSCPNVKQGAIAFGQEPDMLEEVTRACKAKAGQPIIMKLTPNVTDIRTLARAAEAGGADAVSLINTLTGMKIDVERRRFLLANRTGGLSGPAIHPIAVRMVYEAAHAVKIPVIGMGGVASGADALEMMLAGATAVGVGTATFHEPGAMPRIIREMEAYMERNGFSDIRALIGAVS